MKQPSRIVLASTSARRRAMLESVGFDVVTMSPVIDDGPMRIRTKHAMQDCSALAWFKAAQVIANRIELERCAQGARVIVAADTVCVLGDRVMGKPKDAREARGMIEAAIGNTQRVVTGVCIVDLATHKREIFAQESLVHFGAVSQQQLDEHIASGAWMGRAGGYNLDELVERHWSVRWEGDRTTVVGLPMQELVVRLGRYFPRDAA